jgi:hypothetical protein
VDLLVPLETNLEKDTKVVQVSNIQVFWPLGKKAVLYEPLSEYRFVIHEHNLLISVTKTWKVLKVKINVFQNVLNCRLKISNLEKWNALI